jgi:hypothetical protein
VFDNGSSGDTSEDFMLDIQNPRRLDISKQQGRPGAHQDKDYHALWSNSSRYYHYSMLINPLSTCFMS